MTAERDNPRDPGQLDRLLDQALDSYVAAEPEPALRTRILARAAESTLRPGRRLWLPATLAACALAAAIFVATPRVPHVPSLGHEPHAIAQTQQVQPPSDLESANRAPHPGEAGATRVPHPGEARVGVFASAGKTPPDADQATHRDRDLHRNHTADDRLTEQDRLLLQFVAAHPREAHEVLSHPAPQPIEAAPLIIAPLQIADLATGDTGSAPAPRQD